LGYWRNRKPYKEGTEQREKIKDVLFLKGLGFSLNEIEELENVYYAKDYNQLLFEIIDYKKNEIKNECKEKELYRLITFIDMMDAMYYAVSAVFSKKAYRPFLRQRKKIRNRINRLIKGKETKQVTVWNKMKRKSNRI
jgi:hypothetical protein